MMWVSYAYSSSIEYWFWNNNIHVRKILIYKPSNIRFTYNLHITAMLPSAGEIVKRPHTSLTHNFQAQKNVCPQEASRAMFHSSMECRARTFSRVPHLRQNDPSSHCFAEKVMNFIYRWKLNTGKNSTSLSLGFPLWCIVQKNVNFLR